MTLETYYLSSMSVAATLLSVALVVGIISAVWLVIRLRQILVKLEQISQTTADMTANVKNMVENTTRHVLAIEETFLTAQGLKNIANSIADAFQKRDNPKRSNKDA